MFTVQRNITTTKNEANEYLKKKTKKNGNMEKNNEIQVFYLCIFPKINQLGWIKRFIVWTDSFSAILLLRLCYAVYLKMKNSAQYSEG